MARDALRVVLLVRALAGGWWLGARVDLYDQQQIYHRR